MQAAQLFHVRDAELLRKWPPETYSFTPRCRLTHLRGATCRAPGKKLPTRKENHSKRFVDIDTLHSVQSETRRSAYLQATKHTSAPIVIMISKLRLSGWLSAAERDASDWSRPTACQRLECGADLVRQWRSDDTHGEHRQDKDVEDRHRQHQGPRH
mmetsp:Transcript_36379/g.56852  ORF Transcript_36379/g.56852 Transcript_36379/m.56852 type:complete len:156 (+) Transcript_36379:780-1247(+)